jgi:hypothetical protein
MSPAGSSPNLPSPNATAFVRLKTPKVIHELIPNHPMQAAQPWLSLGGPKSIA